MNLSDYNKAAVQVLTYFQDNIPATILIMLAAGFVACKTVAWQRRWSPGLYIFMGVLGSFLGQFAIYYLGLAEIIDQVSAFRYLFDFLAAYLGSFVLAALVNFLKPL